MTAKMMRIECRVNVTGYPLSARAARLEVRFHIDELSRTRLVQTGMRARYSRAQVGCLTRLKSTRPGQEVGGQWLKPSSTQHLDAGRSRSIRQPGKPHEPLSRGLLLWGCG